MKYSTLFLARGNKDGINYIFEKGKKLWLMKMV